MARPKLKRANQPITPAEVEPLQQLEQPTQLDELIGLKDYPTPEQRSAVLVDAGPSSVVLAPVVDLTTVFLDTKFNSPPLVFPKISHMHTVKLGAVPTDISISWPSSFDVGLCKVFTHRITSAQNPTGHLVAPVFANEPATSVKFRIIRDNSPVPERSVYLGSYSDAHVGPAMQALHVFLLR